MAELFMPKDSPTRTPCLLEMPEGAEEALKGDANEDKPKKRKSKGTKKAESPASEDDASQDA